MRRLVVATGGGAVIRPVNWYLELTLFLLAEQFVPSLLLLDNVVISCCIIRKNMKKGLSVWLDVPLEALARRIAKVGTASRPLLDQPSGDPYTMVTT